MKASITSEEMLNRAAHQHVAVEELDLIVSKTREINIVRERKLQQLTDLLDEVEVKLEL